jgi:hypothetical protein
LFDNCILAEDFQHTFENCTSLTSIPSGLFDNCIWAEDFRHTFDNCTSLTGLAPELWIDFPGALGDDCFFNDTGLDNYGDIPYEWGGP